MKNSITSELQKAIELSHSIAYELRNIGLSKLIELYRSGNKQAARELADSFSSATLSMGLSAEEAVRLLVSDVELSLNPHSALTLYYNFYDRVDSTLLRSLMESVAPNCVEAEEILSGWNNGK